MKFIQILASDAVTAQEPGHIWQIIVIGLIVSVFLAFAMRVVASYMVASLSTETLNDTHQSGPVELTEPHEQPFRH